MLNKKIISIICAGASVLSAGLTTLSAEETNPNPDQNAPAETTQESGDAAASESAPADQSGTETVESAQPTEAPVAPVMNQTDVSAQADAVSIDEKFENTEGTVVVNSEEADTVVLPAPERDGYTFLYWNSAKDGSGTTYQAGDEFTIGTEDELYAIWEKDEVKTIFYVEPDGENVVGTNEIVEYQKAETDEEKAQAIQGNPEASAASTEAPEASASASAEATEVPSASPNASASAEAIQ